MSSKKYTPLKFVLVHKSEYTEYLYPKFKIQLYFMNLSTHTSFKVYFNRN